MNSAEVKGPDAGVTQSDIVLIFAADFAETQEEGYEVPCSNAQVKLSSLVREMLTTAFISPASDCAVSLSIGKKKDLFSEHQTVFVALNGGPSEPLAGLEGAITKNVRRKAAENSARDIVNRIGTTTIEPYSAIVEMSMDNAARAG